MGVGVNSGQVIAGAIGGAGRLNFSVIGGAVNVAARVETETRRTGDSILITGETWTRLSHQFEAESRGKAELKGVADPSRCTRRTSPGTPRWKPVAADDGDGDVPALAAFARRVREATRPRARR